MIRAYSQRLLPPFSGVVQIAEIHNARAQSFDGINWEFHYLPDSGVTHDGYRWALGYALDRSFYRIASLHHQELKPFHHLPAFLDANEVATAIETLAGYLADASVPFPLADIFECWLLDGSDESPLALLYSCCLESQIESFPSRTDWTALPHSKLKIDNTEEELARNEVPVNRRFQDLVTQRAGSRPQIGWIQRSYDPDEGFPGLMVREDWASEADEELCQRYLQRMSARLLMLQGLSEDERMRMEIAAKKHALEVEEYYPLYPDVHDPNLMAAIRVEARLRRNSPQQSQPMRKENKPAVRPLSKDMRIFET